MGELNELFNEQRHRARDRTFYRAVLTEGVNIGLFPTRLLPTPDAPPEPTARIGRPPVPNPVNAPKLTKKARPVAKPTWPRRSVASTQTLVLVDLVAAKHGVTREQILSDNCTYPVAHARHEAMYRLRYEREFTYHVIARVFLRDHSSCIHGVRAHARRMAQAAE